MLRIERALPCKQEDEALCDDFLRRQLLGHFHVALVVGSHRLVVNFRSFGVEEQVNKVDGMIRVNFPAFLKPLR